MADDEVLLPMLMRYPIIAGAVAGVALRLAFSGEGGSNYSAMVGAFIFGTPVAVGMLTVYLAERQRRRSWEYYAIAPMLATALFVFGTLLLFIEGWICAVVIVPMFAVLGAVGGLVMGALCRLTGWPKQTLYGFSLLPLLLVLLGDVLPTPQRDGVIERTLLVHAPAATVWQQLNAVRDIRADEMSAALAVRIGAPMAMSGVTMNTPEGMVRKSRWGKGVHFDELIHTWEPNGHVGWTYRFSEDSFPRDALDDHVVVGGHYFNLLDTAFHLTPVAEGTQLSIRVRYRIATQFNFYADWVAQLLLGNLGETGLRLYKHRSEQAWAVHLAAPRPVGSTAPGPSASTQVRQ